MGHLVLSQLSIVIISELFILLIMMYFMNTLNTLKSTTILFANSFFNAQVLFDPFHPMLIWLSYSPTLFQVHSFISSCAISSCLHLVSMRVCRDKQTHEVGNIGSHSL